MARSAYAYAPLGAPLMPAAHAAIPKGLRSGRRAKRSLRAQKIACPIDSLHGKAYLSTSYPQVMHNARGAKCRMVNDFFSVLSAAVAFLSAAVALSAARSAIRERASLRRQVDSCESQLRSLRTSLEEQSSTLETLANRVKMQRVRTAALHVKDDREPDPYQNPDEWRKSMNRQLAMRGK